MMSSVTLAILKPDVVSHRLLCRRLLDQLCSLEHLAVVGCRKKQLSRQAAQQFYAVHLGKFFFGRLVAHMSSGPSVALLLRSERRSAVGDFRELLGPTKVYKTIFSQPTSLRGQFGLTDTRNAIHGSDSAETVKSEAAFYFAADVLSSALVSEKCDETRLADEIFS